MKIYLVGGAVRDKLLGLPVKEKDYVVVGATVEMMLAQGFKQVGKEFPVFLHPQTREEYALARVENKVDKGYQGFTFDTSTEISLKEDLARRDLTINAMAYDLETEALIDPFGGQQDLEHRILRHVSPAFAEDPVRMLRIGRFLARYSYLGFTVADETLDLLRKMTREGEVNALVAERVWKEWERALTEKNPEKFFALLQNSNALSLLFPSLSLQAKGMQALIHASMLSPHAPIRLAALLYDSPDANTITELCQRYRLPNTYKELALVTQKHYATALKGAHLSAEELTTLFRSLDIYRRQARFDSFVTVCQAIAKTENLCFDHKHLIMAAHLAQNIPAQPLLNQGLTGKDLAAALNQKRQEKLTTWLASL